ncbi:MAG TPA: helix-turn-helix domain-containing protein [Candidatus Aquilonibacter sp.]|nr:helix-turn-helix domain-containing protein [Candidatus Aquilonibacter sp.]
MNNSSEVHRLANSIAGLAETITEIINAKVKESNEAKVPVNVVLQAQALHPIAVEGWVGKKSVAEHFKISVRTTDNWMKSGLLPYIKIGKNVRFKLSEAEETINRSFKIRGRW